MGAIDWAFTWDFIVGHINYWLVIVLMMTGLYIVVDKGNFVKKIVGERRFWRDPNQDLPTAPIPFSKVAIDSSRAFVLADQAAKKAGLGFDMIHFQLRGRDLRNEPVWVMNLVDSGQKSIGVLYISAITGENLVAKALG